jgi:hypothetical protein
MCVSWIWIPGSPLSRRPGMTQMQNIARLFVCLLVFLTGSATAQRETGQPVDLALVLAVDASGSVDQIRFELQKQGYVAAFRHPRVIGAILSGPTQSIAVIMMQWTGPALQVTVVPWTKISDAASANAFADAIARAPRQLFGGGTSISGAIDASMGLLFDNPYRATRRVIDISGDGSNNRGRSVNQARDEATARGVGINGLPILALEPNLDQYFRDNVIGGPGAFMIAAKDFETFGEAILKKLIAEIAGVSPIVIPGRREAASPESINTSDELSLADASRAAVPR